MLRGLLALATVALRRVGANLGLAGCALLALVVAVGLAASIPLYAEAASLRVLQEELARREAQQGRSPFAILARYVASQNQNRSLPWEAVAQADALLRAAPAQFGLPASAVVRHARSEPMRLALPDVAGTPTAQTITLGFQSGLDAQIRLLAGASPSPATDLRRPVETLVSRGLADEVGLNVGDRLRALAGVRGQTVAIELSVAGIWEPSDPRDPAWPLQPDAFRDVLLLPEASFTGPIGAALQAPVSQVLWHVRLDPAALTPAQAPPLLARLDRLRVTAAGLLPGLRVEQGPADALAEYRRDAGRLTAQLAVVAVPTLVLVVAFVVLVAGLMVQRQSGEVALLKTRGVHNWQLLGLAAVEWLLLGGVALLLGSGLGLLVARAVAASSSFLQFDPALPPLVVGLTPGGIWAGGAVVAVSLAAALLPTAVATRRTLADSQRERSRSPRPPLWQRAGLDLLLLPVAIAGLLLLRQGSRLLGERDPVANPLLLAIPTLLCLSLGLLTIRLAPPLLGLLARLAAWPAWPPPLLALRALARQPEVWRGSLLLLILTLSLALVSAGVAVTADAALDSAVAYRVGAMTQLIETGVSTEAPQAGAGGPQRRDIREEPRFLFVPVGERLRVPGINAASRVGRYDASLRLGGALTEAQLVGLDRLTFPAVATTFDPAWAGGESLGALMNQLAASPDGALVSRELLAKGPRIGDRLAVTAELFGDRRELSLRVVGVVDLWPGVSPADGPILVMNLDALFDQMGGQYPYDVWVVRDPTVPLEDVAAGVRRLGVPLVDLLDAAELIRAERARPERQGLFGMLSAGFLAAGGLSLAGFVLGAVMTAGRRTVELGVLRAMGLSGRSAVVALVLEQALLVLVGLAGGLAIGSLTVALVVPALQIGAGPWPGIPPTPVAQPWDELLLLCGLVALALGLAVLALALIQWRVRPVEAVKLGEVS